MIGTTFGNSASSGGAAFEFGNALLFDGVNDYVTFNSFSISTGVLGFWFKIPSTGQVEVFNLNSNANYFIGFNQSLSVAYYRAGSTLFTFDFSSGFAADTWHSCVVSINTTTPVGSGRVNMWIDNVQSDDVDQASTRNFVCDRLNLREGGYDLFTLDEIGVKIGEEATTTQASNFYNGGDGADFSSIWETPNRHYKLNESGTDTIAVNDGSDGENGTLNNFPTSGMWVAH